MEGKIVFQIERGTLDFLLMNIKSVEQLKLAEEAIKDYEEDSRGYFEDYKRRIRELKDGFWKF